MRVDRLIVSPSRDAKDVVEAAIIRPEHGLAAVVYAQASAAPDHVVIDAAKRGAAAWKPGTGGGSPLRAVLRPWIARIASAVRQAGEACEIGGLGAAREAGDGGDFEPDPKRHAFGFCLEGAFVHIAERAAAFAAIGRCAVARWQPGRIEPLHDLHTVAAMRSLENPFPSDHAHGIVTSVLGRDPDNLLSNLTERRVELVAGQSLVLMSPSLATPVIGRGIVPPAAATLTSESLFAWFRDQVPGPGYGTAVLISG